VHAALSVGGLCWDNLQQIEEQKDQETKRIANEIDRLIYQDLKTQPELVEKLVQFENPITDVFAQLLGPRGSGGWKLLLKRSRRGAPMRDPAPAGIYSHFLDQVIEEHGKRGAIKRLAKEFNMSPDAIRSAIRREGVHVVDGKLVKSTYYKRRKRSGRK